MRTVGNSNGINASRLIDWARLIDSTRRIDGRRRIDTSPSIATSPSIDTSPSIAQQSRAGNIFPCIPDVLLDAAGILRLFNPPANLIKSLGFALEGAPEINHEYHDVFISNHLIDRWKTLDD